MGVVLLARDEHLQREVAIKLIRPDLPARPEANQRFLREARTMARVRHENVVEVYAYGQLSGQPYFVMEYVPGSDLQQLLDRAADDGQQVPVVEALGLLDQVCRGVHAIHRRGALHGDLKPGNILIGPASRVAVADMGLARVWDVADTNPQPIAGTPAYMAPECIREHVPAWLAARADVFALGVLAYELLTGQLPWDVTRVQDLVQLYVNGAPPLPPSALRPALTGAFDAAVLAALELEPERRTESAEALRAALLHAGDALTEAAHDVRILVADDDPDFRALARETLAHGFAGARIELVNDGQAALEACRREAASLAVIDLDMPGLNGVQLTATLRAESDIPIVVVTASGGAPDWKLLLALGATGFLVKPIDPYALITLARRAIRHA